MPTLARSRSGESTSGSHSTTCLFAGVMARVQPHLSFLPRQWRHYNWQGILGSCAGHTSSTWE